MFMYLDNSLNINRLYMKDRYKDEKEAVDTLLKDLLWDDKIKEQVESEATKLIELIRNSPNKIGDIDSFLQAFSLDTDEGISLMCLAEALLRIPDNKTADELISDKIISGDWGLDQDDSLFGKIANLGLNLTKKTISGPASTISKPFIRGSVKQSVEHLGKQFILGEDIIKAQINAEKYRKKKYKISYDMLGEGARTSEDADKYFEAYWQAIEDIGANNPDESACVSVKLSALHPRYEFAQYERCVPEIRKKLMELCQLAYSHNISLTVDAEESERLDLSLDIIASICNDSSLSSWNGFGLALQAYQKRSYKLIDSLIDIADNNNKKLQIRLVKGAYWDSEIKNSQKYAHTNYPVFTRKFHSDLSYISCSQKLLIARDSIYPMFATHNVHSIYSILEMDRKLSGGLSGGYEFQRLFGMGEKLYDTIIEEDIAPVSIYAPIGTHENLLAYLVRRLLENGANSSFVNKINDSSTNISDLVSCPIHKSRENLGMIHPEICLPGNIYPDRKNSSSIDLTDDEKTARLISDIDNKDIYEASTLINGLDYCDGILNYIKNPANTDEDVGISYSATSQDINTSYNIAKIAFPNWNKVPATEKSKIFMKFADLLEENRNKLISLCVREAGKTIEDSIDEIREAVDFARYYALQGEKIFKENGQILPSITGEENVLHYQGRGVFVCISPWNFPLAIFSGQILAALMAGNCVIAKPAEQTPIIAYETVKLLIEAGIPKDVISLIIGDGDIGAKIIDHKHCAGVAFTGSTKVAKAINLTLAKKDGAIVPLIAETGGINAMIADSTSLPEQLVDDVIDSAFGSAGQRCSALRLLCLQDDIADNVINMLKGAINEIIVSNPINISTDIGPLIDQISLSRLISHKSHASGFGKIIAEAKIDISVKDKGHHFAPVAAEIFDINVLSEEFFGPFLHIYRYKSKEKDTLIDQINNMGYGLTFGAHSRIDNFLNKLSNNINCGNIYLNRSTTGAIVESQPFGGRSLSGTGPKAGGPNYLKAFAVEKVITKNLTVSGGNYKLLSLNE